MCASPLQVFGRIPADGTTFCRMLAADELSKIYLEQDTTAQLNMPMSVFSSGQRTKSSNTPKKQNPRMDTRKKRKKEGEDAQSPTVATATNKCIDTSTA